MALAGAVRDPPLAGRAAELDALVDLVQQAALGRAGAVLVSGEAGVGKTALLREGCRRVADRTEVLWAGCLPLTSLAVPFLPLASAVRDWAAGHGVAPPVLGRTAGQAAGEAAVEFDAWLEQKGRQRPVLLIVDDLHWADQSSLDALMYVVAGSAQRRLALAATVRKEEVAPTHPLRRWLADVRRLPGVAEWHLARLGRLATAEQLAQLLGDPPHQSLVDDVFARTHGNPYLTSLLARDLSPSATSLPADLPTDLRDAVARAWYALSPPARELTRLIAVAGRPQRTDQLRDVTSHIELDRNLVPLLREAVDGGVLDAPVAGRYWFRHPLLAEVLEDGLLPEEQRVYHAAFATELELRADDADVEQVVELADHHFRAGHGKDAYRWALLASEAAEGVGGATETLRLLRRALELWPQVPDPSESAEDLLRRIRDAAAHAGDFEEELVAVQDLLVIVDRTQQPLRAAELLVRRMHLRFLTGRDFFPVADMLEAVRLSAADTQSPEYALAVAELADAELWHGIPTGPARAEEAVRLARACRSDRALTYALVAWVMAQCMADQAGRIPIGVAAAEEAQAAAARTRDFFGFVHATMWAGNCLDSFASWEVVDYARQGREEMTRLGAPHSYVAWLCGANEAMGLLLLGNWRACADRLRVVLGETPGPLADIDARLTAALLASWQGRLAEAAAHLARAEELFAEQSGFLVSTFDAVRAELAVAAGDTERAVSAALAGADQHHPPTLSERLIPLAARAIADQAQALRDRGAEPSPALARLDDLYRRYPKVIADDAPEQPVYKLQLRAMQALYDAEVCRGRGDAAAGSAWLAAADACRQGQLPWDEAYTQWRAAEAVLSDRVNRAVGVAALRRAHELAVDLQAAPLLADIEALATGARVSLVTVLPEMTTDDDVAVSGLTPREREILAHVLAGRTYAEIARALVVSEKTVSVHISNMLRKTGAANRVELAQLARRLASPGSTSKGRHWINQDR